MLMLNLFKKYMIIPVTIMMRLMIRTMIMLII